MADKKLSEVTQVTDMAYVPVILSDGSVGQIAKADLATVVAGLMKTNPFYTSFKGEIGSSYDLDSLVENGIYYSLNDVINAPITNKYGFFLVLSNLSGRALQLTFDFSDYKIYMRGKTGDGWGSWHSVNLS